MKDQSTDIDLTPTENTAIFAGKRTPPTSSWWAEGKTREELSETVRQRFARRNVVGDK